MSSKFREHKNLESHATSSAQGEAVNPSAADSPRLEEIRIRAYEIYMERGGQPSHVSTQLQKAFANTFEIAGRANSLSQTAIGGIACAQWS